MGCCASGGRVGGRGDLPRASAPVHEPPGRDHPAQVRLHHLRPRCASCATRAAALSLGSSSSRGVRRIHVHPTTHLESSGGAPLQTPAHAVLDLRTVAEIQVPWDGELLRTLVWSGVAEGLPVYFLEPHSPHRCACAPPALPPWRTATRVPPMNSQLDAAARALPCCCWSQHVLARADLRVRGRRGALPLLQPRRAGAAGLDGQDARRPARARLAGARVCVGGGRGRRQ